AARRGREDSREAGEATRGADGGGRLRRALQAGEELLALRRRVQGGEHPEAVTLRWDLEALRKVAALPAVGRAAWRQALRGAEEAQQLREKGRYAEALRLQQKLLALSRDVLGEQHPDTAARYSNLALSLHDQGKHAEAEPLFRRALAIYQQALGEQHPHTGI